MKIAFISSHNLIDIIGNEVDYLSPKKLPGVNWQDYDGIIIQLDLTPMPSELYALMGGWTILQRLFSRNEEIKFKPIVLTSWNVELIKESMINNHYGILKATKLLASPLIKFIPLRELYKNRNQLITLFDVPLRNNHEDNLLKQDIEHNLFLSSIIHEVLHQFKDEVRQTIPFDPKLLVDKLVPQLYEYLNHDFSIHKDDYYKNLLLQIERFHTEYLPACRNETAFIYRLEQLESLIEAVINPLESSPGKLCLQILYIDDNKDHADRLGNVLKEYGIICHHALNQEMAEELIQREENICAVLCDFRFYAKDKRIARQQGYHILESLQAQFKGLKYAFLSDRAGLTNALPESLRWQWPEFRKWEIIDGFPKEEVFKNEGLNIIEGKLPNNQIRKGLPALMTFLDLAEQGRLRKKFTPSDKLVKVLNGWSYEKNIDWIESNELEIIYKSIKILRKFSPRNMLSKNYKGINSRYTVSRKIKDLIENERMYLFNRIFLRRLTLGMLQMPINNFMPVINQFGLDTNKQVARWGSIYYFLSHGNVNELSSENVSKAFSKLGLLTSKDYKYQELITKEDILPNEWKWLYRHGPELSKIMSN